MPADSGPLAAKPGFEVVAMTGAFVDERPTSRTGTGRDEPAGVAPEQDRGAWSADLSDRFYADSHLTIPGQGERPAGCGEWFPAEFCASCGQTHFAESDCQQRSCPESWRSWTGEAAKSAVTRFASARHAADGWGKRAHHMVVSPPEGSIQSLREFGEMTADAYDVAKDQGVRGGIAIPHAWRVVDEAKAAFRADVEADEWDEDRGIWNWIRDQEADWRDQVYWSPHVHIVGLGAEIAENDPDDLDGWVCHRIRTFSRFSLADDDAYAEMVGAVRYGLSHVAFEEDAGGPAYRYFGELAPTKFSPDEELSAGAQKAIERKVAEAVDGADDGEKRCTVDECDGTRRSMDEAGLALRDDRFVEEIGPEQEQRLRAAHEWFIGAALPPPGLQRPRSEAQAEEALSALVDGV